MCFYRWQKKPLLQGSTIVTSSNLNRQVSFLTYKFQDYFSRNITDKKQILYKRSSSMFNND